MTNFDDIKKLEGQTVLVATENKSIYAGKISNVRPPKDGKCERTVALADFNYRRWFVAFSGNGKEKMYREENSKDFPFWETDNLSVLDEKNLLKELQERGYKECTLS